MGAEVVTPDDTAGAPNEPALSRDDVLARYRRIREIGKQHNAELVRYLSHDAVLQQARRLGLAQGPRGLGYFFLEASARGGCCAAWARRLAPS